MNRAAAQGRDTKWDAGASEVVVTMFVAGAVLVFVLLVTLAGRTAEARIRVNHAAEASAQSAALARDDASAIRAATDSATSSLGGFCVNGPAVTVDTSSWRPAGVVVVAIRCRLRTADLAPLPLPGTLALSSSSAAVLDTFRYTEPAP